jgi:membrane associated rhomboid family serine protease
MMSGAYLVSLFARLPYGTAIEYGIVPEHPDPISLIAALFLHVNGFHLLFNAALLWFFGRNVEAALGSAVFAACYLLGGLAANLAQIGAVLLFLPSQQDLPIVGASGAIAVVMGAFAALFPHARLGRSGVVSEDGAAPRTMPVSWMWGVWIAFQVYGVARSVLGLPQPVGVWGHAAGFAVGLGAASAFRYRHPRKRPEGGASTAQQPLDASKRLLPLLTLSLDPAEILSAAEALERQDFLEETKSGVLRALALSLEHRAPETAWQAYRWLEERHEEGEISPQKRLDAAQLLASAGNAEAAWMILKQIPRSAPPETAAQSLLAAARIFGSRMSDPSRAEDALRLIESRYAQTQTAAFVSVERERLKSLNITQNKGREL